jgi:cytoskeletal protein RodZ
VTSVRRKSKKKKTSEDKPYNLAPSYLVYTFEVILAAVLGIVVLLVLLLVLGWSLPKAPPSNTHRSSFQNRPNQTASEASSEENIANNHSVYLRGVISSLNNWVHMYNVNKD